MSEGINDNPSEPNEPESRSGDRSKQEHETHTTALVILSLAVLAIIATVFYLQSGTEDSLSPGNYDQNQAAQSTTTTSGYAVPTSDVQTEDQVGMSGFPSSLTIPDDADIGKNYAAGLGKGGIQRTIRFDTRESITAVVDRFESWAESNGYSVETSSAGSQQGSLVAKTESRQLTVVANTSDNDNRRSVQITYVVQADQD